MPIHEFITNLLPTSWYSDANLENPGQQHSAIEELHLADNAITATGRFISVVGSWEVFGPMKIFGNFCVLVDFACRDLLFLKTATESWFKLTCYVCT